jgi:hypothetical protein
MSTEAEYARKIAERVARRVSASPSAPPAPSSATEVSAELSSVRATLSELQNKLAQLEAKVSADTSEYQSGTSYSAANTAEQPVPLTHSPWLAGVNAAAAHPSQERFGVEEATVSELVDFFEKEKMCSVEPGGKPCDHCAMCSSRGF